jgi:hypothetical protein
MDDSPGRIHDDDARGELVETVGERRRLDTMEIDYLADEHGPPNVRVISSNLWRMRSSTCPCSEAAAVSGMASGSQHMLSTPSRVTRRTPPSRNMDHQSDQPPDGALRVIEVIRRQKRPGSHPATGTQ